MREETSEQLRSAELEIDRIVREEIESRLGSYLRSNRATLASRDLSPEHGVAAYELTPSNTRAASIWIATGGREVSVTVGHGSFELWEAPGWRDTFASVLQAVAEGRYRERVRRGLIFERGIRMRFEGTDFSPRYARLSYDDDEEVPGLGEVGYEAW